MDKMRQEFEAWAKTTSLRNFLFWHPSDNQYEVHAVQTAFDGWKASRAALRDELKHAVFSEDKHGSGLILSERVFEAIGDDSK